MAPGQLLSLAQELGLTIPTADIRADVPRVNRRIAAGHWPIKSYCCVIDPLGAWEPLTATKLLPPVAIVPPEIE